MPYKICQQNSNYLEAPDKTGIIATTDDPLYCHYIEFDLNTYNNDATSSELYTAEFSLIVYSKKASLGFAYKSGLSISDAINYFSNVFSSSGNYIMLPVVNGRVTLGSSADHIYLLQSIKVSTSTYDKNIYFTYYYFGSTTDKIYTKSVTLKGASSITISPLSNTFIS